MKKLVPLTLMVLGATVFAAAQQQAQSGQSLGDVARSQRTHESTAPAHKVWTNDDFQSAPAPAPVEAPQPAPKAEGDSKITTPDDSQKTVDLATGAEKGEAGDKARDAKDKEKEGKDSPGEQEKLDAEWKSKIDAQKAKIADLQREYSLTDREYKLAATSYYADAGNRLRDQKDFADKETKYRDTLSTLKQNITDEQTKLADLQEQAHKAGANKAYD
jgi:hypothetical protein